MCFTMGALVIDQDPILQGTMQTQKKQESLPPKSFQIKRKQETTNRYRKTEEYNETELVSIIGSGLRAPAA